MGTVVRAHSKEHTSARPWLKWFIEESRRCALYWLSFLFDLYLQDIRKALDSKSGGLGFDSHCWSCIEVSGKLFIPCCKTEIFITCFSIYKLGSGSDFAPFVDRIGVSSVDLLYLYDPGLGLSSYPLYHTIYETFHLVNEIMDPDFVVRLQFLKCLQFTMLGS